MKRLKLLGLSAALALGIAGIWWTMQPTCCDSNACSRAADTTTKTPTCTPSSTTAATSAPKISEPIAKATAVAPETKATASVEKQDFATWAAEKKAAKSKQRRFKDAYEGEIKKTLDPALGYVPSERLWKALDQTKRRQQELLDAGYYTQRDDVLNSKWRERGPNNIGGRTNAIMVDLNDPTSKTVYAGSSGGGVWRTNDITAPVPVWNKLDDFWGSIAIGGMAQDPSDPNYIYIATGDFFDSRGMGVYRSTDGGVTFNILPSTMGTSNFHQTQSVAVNPTNGDVYVASSNGLMRSTNRGDTWQAVLTGGSCWDVETTTEGKIYVARGGSMFRSSTGASGTWTSISSGNGFPSLDGRAEFNVCASDPSIIYAVGQQGSGGSPIYLSTNGGDSWAQKGSATYPTGATFAGTQAWYDLDIMCNPTNPDQVFVGGLDLFVSANKGASWTRISNWAGGAPQYVHADQHTMIFDPHLPNVALFGNDGGVYRSNNAGNALPTIVDRNFGYQTALFYNVAMHPDTLAGFFLAGAQDNGSNRIEGDEVGGSFEVLGGDGFTCFIDQDQPQYQITSLYDGEFALSSDGGYSFGGGVGTNGSFYSIAGYDNATNTLYAETYDADYYRFTINGASEAVDAAGANFTGNVSHVKVCPLVANRVYFGTYGGKVYRVEDANGSNPTAVQVASVNGSVSSVDVDPTNADHMLLTVSNYGVNNVFETVNGGTNWSPLDGSTLPDMPVRWCLFNPNNTDQAFIATETGVWATDNLNGAATEWIPPTPNQGTPLVRSTMLVYRSSDKMIAVGTFGRGVWTSDVLSDPRAVAKFEKVQYLQANRPFKGSLALGAESFSWTFGDNGTSTEENPTHSYTAIGSYPVKLTINGTLSTPPAPVKVLPDLPTPFIPGFETYGGDFETHDEQFGAYTERGSAWERGNSTIPAKAGTHSGAYAYVIAPNDQYYAPNTNTYLYTPNYDLSTPGIYEFSFWGRWKMQPGVDAMNVQYSLDRGNTWQVLGTQGEGWYNFASTSNTNAFPNGTPFFTDIITGYTKFTTSLSQLSGNANVAFRFQFKSDGTGSHAGIAIDDIEITSYQDELRTKVPVFTGAFTNGQCNKIEVKWKTQPEYNCQKFFLEVSENGVDFAPPVEITQGIVATGGTTATEQNYSYLYGGLRSLYFFRLKVINLQDTFYVGPIAVRCLDEEPVKVHGLFPNPFTDHVTVLFDGFVEEPIKFQLFNALGQLIVEETQQLTSAITEFQTGKVPSGAYFLTIQIGNAEPVTFKLLSGS